MYDDLTESIKAKWDFKMQDLEMHFQTNVLYQHTCKHCGKDFQSKSIDSKWCRKKCENDQRIPYKRHWAQIDRGLIWFTLEFASMTNPCVICDASHLKTSTRQKTCGGKSCQKTYKNIQRNKYERHKWRTDPKYRLDRRIRLQLRRDLKNRGMGKHQRTYEMLDFNRDELIKHIESKFTDGMSWDNIDEWHLDHIIPKAAFKYKSTDDATFKTCWSLVNLQPKWAEDNMEKSSKFDGGYYRKGERI